MKSPRALLVVLLPLALSSTGKSEDCPMHAEHTKASEKARAEKVDARGDQAMGFDHTKTSHHFRLLADGGAIEAEAAEASDVASRDAIRKHFAEIAGRFADGDFAVPMFVHAEVPPGVTAMKELRKKIGWSFEPSERGGRVRVRTSSSKALAAIHEFLKFQTRDHRTGDAEAVVGR